MKTINFLFYSSVILFIAAIISITVFRSWAGVFICGLSAIAFLGYAISMQSSKQLYLLLTIELLVVGFILLIRLFGYGTFTY
jgi:hypothetical protein